MQYFYMLITVFVTVFLCFRHVSGLRISEGRQFSEKLRTQKVRPGIQLPDEQYYTFQTVNHFDGGDLRQWKQRYFINNATYRPGGPIFLMLGGEEAANPLWLADGAWTQYADVHGAFMVLLEHRYYGKSQPVPDISTENMEYLSSRQALADTAQFVDYCKWWYHMPNASVVVFGGSYAGSLAAWMRSKYPYIVDGAVASSAPLVAVMDFQGYYEGVGEAVDTTGPGCRAAILDATTRMYDWWGQQEKRLLMQKIFRLCDKINHDALLDLTVFFYNLAENYAGVVQYEGDNRDFLGVRGTNLTAEKLCDVMTDETRGDTIQRYADVNSMILDTYEEQCLNLRYVKLLTTLNQTSWDSESADGRRQWLWQRCSEFGWARSSWGRKQPFGQYFLFPWNFTTDQCIDAFAPKIFGGEQVGDNCDETNRYYGGLSLPISNVVFVNGNLDPWRKVGPVDTLPNASGDYEIINVEGAAHCADMYPPSVLDPPGLQPARNRISDHIAKWIRR